MACGRQPPCGTFLSGFDSLADLVEKFKDSDFDTLLAGFDGADLDALLNGENKEFQEEAEKELSQSDITIQAGNYRFRMRQNEFGAWMDALKQQVGFDKESVVAEIKRRLEI